MPKPGQNLRVLGVVNLNSQSKKESEVKHCPACKQPALRPGYLETGLPAYSCTQCGGAWILSNEYLKWLQNRREEWPETDPVSALSPVTDTQHAALCPDCGRLLRRYRIGSDIPFYLDRCETCNGVWFDQNEWQTLKAHNLADKVNEFFTKPWQEKLLSEERRRRFDTMYRDRFGEADYEKIKHLREWFWQHPQGPSLLAFVTDKDPYQV